MSGLFEGTLRGLTWYGQARDELRSAAFRIGLAGESCEIETDHFALFLINEARAHLDAAEGSIRKTIRAREQPSRERELR